MNMCYRILGMALILSIVPTTSHATADLLTAYRDGVQNDQAFKSASAARLATNEALPQSWSTLLPNVGISAESTMNRQLSNVNSLSTSTTPIKFNTNGYTLSATQSILNLPNWFKVAQASDVVKQANAVYAAAAQDLIIRVAQAYFNILLAEDTLRYTIAQKVAYLKQLEQARDRFSVGLDTVVDVYNAQAAYDGAVAEEISNKNTVANNYRALEVITGILYPKIAPIAQDRLPLVAPQPAQARPWVIAAENQNLSLRAQRYAADAARQAVKVNMSGHAPVVNAVGEYTQQRSGPQALDNLQTTTDSSQAGFQVNMPIFQGGLVISQTREAQYNFQKATADMEQIHNEVVAKTYQTYNDIMSGISKIKADRQAVASSMKAVESNIAGFEAGTVTIIDVLVAQRELYNVQKSYAADQYQYLLSTLILKQQVGTLSEADIMEINSWLKRTPQTYGNRPCTTMR